jgi:cytochrome b6-f complex iron-sulfur subunit
MSDALERREFLSRSWKYGLGLIGVAGVWTSWDFLRPRNAGGFGGEIRTVPVEEVPEDGVLAVPAARAYLTKLDGEVVALSEKCTHLGCRVPWCDGSSQFECPCHGSVFNRIGEFREGPAPRGMDRYAVSIVDGVVVVDTGAVEDGDPPGDETIDEPPTGPSCGESGHA